MKYKDFKVMSQKEMKQIIGGYEPEACSVSANCPGGAGTISCSGIVGDETTGGCDKVEGTTISTVTCRQTNGTYSTQSCTAQE